MSRKNAISWFEIPAVDMDRAVRFYETILNVTLTPLQVDNLRMTMFPVADADAVGGALIYNPDNYSPSSQAGTLIYLNANPDLQTALDQVEKAGGKVVLPKTQISEEYGFMAVIHDTEGNRIALHSAQ